MELTWNIVIRGLEKDPVFEKKLREKIGKLEKHLKHFPPDAVHLHLAFDRHPRKPVYTSALTLRLPSNVLRAEKSSEDFVAAFDEGVKVLIRQLEQHKSELRHEADWSGRRREDYHERVRFTDSPAAAGQGPETVGEIVHDLLKDNYPRFFGFVRRQVARAEMSGTLSPGAVDPRGVLDEAACRALTAPESKPEKLSFRLWIYHLIREELRKRFDRLNRERRDSVSLTRRRYLEGDAERGGDYEPERPLGMADRALESALAELSEVLPHPEESPEAVAEHRDLLDYLHRIVHEWPAIEQHVFELHFVEGFSETEVALVERISESEVKHTVASIQNRLRKLLFREAEPGARIAERGESVSRD